MVHNFIIVYTYEYFKKIPVVEKYVFVDCQTLDS